MPEAPKRHDPPSRPVDGALNDMAVLKNQDPNRVYCLANPNDYHTGVNWMQRLGWVVETWRKDGVKVIGGPTQADGEALTVGGDVVMSLPRAVHEERLQNAWAVADRRAKSIGQDDSVGRVYGQVEGFDRG